MLDADLADLYGVPTKRLNEQVKRNVGRFPHDFMFQLTDKEKSKVVANCDHLNRLKFSKAKPFAFTEHGAIMLASVLNSPVAINTSVLIVRAFVRFRKLMESDTELLQKIEVLESKYDKQFQLVFAAIKSLLEVKSKPRREIGFRSGQEK